MQEVCSKILQLTAGLTQLIRSGTHAGEDQDQLNHMYIDVAAIARSTRNAKESRDVFLHNEVSMQQCSL